MAISGFAPLLQGVLATNTAAELFCGLACDKPMESNTVNANDRLNVTMEMAFPNLPAKGSHSTKFTLDAGNP